MRSDLKKIGNWFTTNNLWHKTFNDFSQNEIEGLCQTVLNNTDKTIISQCYICGSKSFWRFKGENQQMWTCIDCHPPVGKESLELLKIEIKESINDRSK